MLWADIAFSLRKNAEINGWSFEGARLQPAAEKV